MKHKQNKRLDRVRSHLRLNNLNKEASELLYLQIEFNKIAGIRDEDLTYRANQYDGKSKNNPKIDSFVNDILSDPEVIDCISICAKLSAVLVASTGYGAGASLAILQAARAADVYSAVLYARRNDWISCVFSLVSAIVTVPNKTIYKMYDFVLSEKFAQLLLRFKILNHDEAWYYASYIADFFRYSIPLFLDVIINLLGDFLNNIEQFSIIIAKEINNKEENISKILKDTINKIISNLTNIKNSLS